MFQRLKNAVDARIAEEQARQKALASPTSSGSPTSAVRRSTSIRSESPAKGTASRRKLAAGEGTNDARGPDPAEFEKAFVIDDESETPTRVGTPALLDEKSELLAGQMPDLSLENVEQGAEAIKPVELPPDVKAKLRKLDKLESRYQELLRSYRIAHARAISIEPFERALKENTPLVSIGDSDAFVEYVQQLSLRGDMVMDELKRVSGDRDELKKKFDVVEKEASSAKEELAALKKASEAPEVQSVLPKLSTSGLESGSVKSPAQAVLSLFSPKHKAEVQNKENKDVSEEFFSYDDEIPQLQSDLKAKTAEIEDLKTQVKTVQDELAAARENSGGLVQSLEKATREISESPSGRESDEKFREVQKETIRKLEEKLQTTEEQLKIAESNLTEQEKATKEKLESKDADLSKSNARLAMLDADLKELQRLKATNISRIEELEQQVTRLNSDFKIATENPIATEQSKSLASASPTNPPITPTACQNGPKTVGKKKNKRKKKGGNAANTANADSAATSKESSKDDAEEQAPAGGLSTDELNAEIQRLKDELAKRDVEIEKLQSKKKTESDLREEIETMQENLINIGQEHVEAKDDIKKLKAEKAVLEEKLKGIESQIADQKGEKAMTSKLESEYNKLAVEFEDLKIKSSTLQSDLGAAQQLATSRYKDLTCLRDALQKAQPELKSLREENATLKTAKEELSSKTGELRRMETREKDLKADFTRFKKMVEDRDSEIRTLKEKVGSEINSRLKAEDQNRVAQRDLRRAEAEKIELSATGEKAARELAKVQEEATKLRSRVRELETQVSKLNSESQTNNEELDMKNAQYLSAQSLVGSMRDQTSEMATQLKEIKEQSESLEEELAEVQRLLNERTREGETMRRLLADVDERAEVKVREMKERMEAAIEERDRAEDEASTNGRRRAREVDELKVKLRDAERDLKRAEQERDESEQKIKDWRKQREELEKSSEKAAKEVREVNGAMGELRSALDESERQAREAEKQKTDLRRLLDEATQRYEKLQKSQKVLSEELRGLKSHSKLDLPSSRSSSDSRPSSNGRRDSVNGSASAPMDYVYLKTILLQFLEQKDKKHQAQLVPVIGKLLHFDKKDEQKWMSAISSVSVK